MSDIPKNFYNSLGASGLKISKVVLGCMGFGNKEWAEWVMEDEDEVMKIMKAAYDSGVRTFDTADIYSNGDSERLVGKFLKKFDIPRESMVIMSKGHSLVSNSLKKTMFEADFYGPDHVNRMGLSRKHLYDAVKASVERLGTYIDLYQIHRADPTTPAEETMRALDDLVKAGDIRYIGASTMHAYEFIELQNVAELKGYTKFISMQNYYNLLYREEEREMIPYCKKNGVGLIPWSPLAAGYLARPFGDEKNSTRGGSKWLPLEYALAERSPKVIERVEEVAKKHGVSMAVIAVAWAILKGTNPIVGVSSTKRLKEAIEGAVFELPKEDAEYLEELYTPGPVIGPI